MIHLFFQQTLLIGIVPYLLIALILLFVSNLTLNSIRKEIIEFKENMDKPTLNAQLMFKAGECLINMFKWGIIGGLITLLVYAIGEDGELLGYDLGFASGVIAIFTISYTFSRMIAMAYYLKGGKTE